VDWFTEETDYTQFQMLPRWKPRRFQTNPLWGRSGAITSDGTFGGQFQTNLQ